MPVPHILLLEDDVQGAPIRIAILQRSGYATGWVTTVDQAQTLLALNSHIDILLVACEMDASLLSFCEQVKRKGDVSILILGKPAFASRQNSRYCDAYVQALMGPQVWLDSLAQLVRRRQTYKRNSRRNILNVDDNEFQRYATSRMLRFDGYHVLEAACGARTLELAMGQHPDLIVLDVNLPDIDGFEVCRRLRGNPDTAGIPIMHLSATYTTSAARARGLANGADEYLCQPIAREQLLGTVESLLSRASL